jgi:hypothetical protein
MLPEIGAPRRVTLETHARSKGFKATSAEDGRSCRRRCLRDLVRELLALDAVAVVPVERNGIDEREP